MATVTTDINAASLTSALQKSARKRNGNPFSAQGPYFVKITRTLSVLTDWDAANDELELCVLPPNTYLLGASIHLSDIDEHATPTVVTDLVADDGSSPITLIDGSTAGQGSGYMEYVPAAVTSPRSTAGFWQNLGGYTLQLTHTANCATAASTATVIAMLELYTGPIAEISAAD